MTCHLHFLNGSRVGLHLVLEQNSFWIGRDPRCEVKFDAEKDLTVSARHAEVVFLGDSYQLRDFSTNGTMVNGQLAKQVILKSGDVIELGQHGPRLRFEAEISPTAAAGTTQEDYPSTVAVSNYAPPPAQAQPQPRPQAGLSQAKPQRQRHPQPRPNAAAAEQGRAYQHPAELVMPIPEENPEPEPEPKTTSLEDLKKVLPVSPISLAPGPGSTNNTALKALDATTPSLPTTAKPELTETDQSSAGSATMIQVALQRLPSGTSQTFKQQVIRLGRDPTADVPFDTQRELLVSYHHAKIMILDGQAVLFDSDSTNGTFINGERISRQELIGGEVIELGRNGPRLQVEVKREVVAVSQTARAARSAAGKTVFGQLTDLQNLSLGEASLLHEFPLADRMLLGRDTHCQIVLDSLYVSHQHALLEKRDEGVYLKDLNSANGTFVNGERITETRLVPGAEFVVGTFLLKFSGAKILLFDTRTKIWVDAFNLTRTDKKTERSFLDNVSLKIQPGELVCILGPSGCGKSTLLKCLNGSVPPDEGAVLMNNIDFYANYEQLKHQVGYVPQDDIIHSQLSVYRTLEYAAQLRLPAGTPVEKREERIKDVLSVLELSDHQDKPVHQLSGGQRKRVSIAVELITDPSIIYLDEPTSGLDPNLEEKMMLLLREMTLRGKTVVVVTHTLDNIHLANKIAFLVEGKLAFFGTEEESRQFFSVTRLPDIYKRIDEKRNNIDSLPQQFSASEIYDRHIRSQLLPRQSEEDNAGEKSAKPTSINRRRKIGPGGLTQFFILTRRYFDILTRDLRHTLILLAQAPIIALFICLAVRTDQAELGPTSTMFLIMSLSALWFGCSNAAREITKESSIYDRERMVNLRIIPYVASKFFVLQFLALVQVLMMLTIVYYLRNGYVLADPPPGCVRWGVLACRLLILDGVPGNFWAHLLNLYLTALSGIGLGLLVSALAGNSDKAMSLVPLILIPQVLFSGSFGIVQADEIIKRDLGYVMTLNWSLDQAKRIAMCAPAEEALPAAGGNGCTTCLHAYDPFKHRLLKKENQSDDAHCRAILPMVSQMTDFPESLQVIEDGLYTPKKFHGHGEAREATHAYRGFSVLAGFCVLLFGAVCLLMRRRDHLTHG